MLETSNSSDFGFVLALNLDMLAESIVVTIGAKGSAVCRIVK